MLRFLVVFGVFALTANAAPADAELTPELTAERFVRALRSGDIDALASLSTAEATVSRDWQFLRKDLETYDCISIRAHEVSVESATDTAMTLRVTVHATAAARGTSRTPIRFPDRWHLEAQRSGGDWRLRNIMVEERVLARRLVAAGDVTPQGIAACAPYVDLETFLVALVDEVDTAIFVATTAPTLDVVSSVARSAGLPAAAILSLRMRVAHLLHTGEPERGAALAAEGRRYAEGTGIADVRAAALLMSGTAEWQNGRHEAAMALYDAAAALLNVIDDPRPAMKALYMRGNLLVYRGSYRDAVMTASALASAAERFDWREGRCATAFQLYTVFGDLQDAQATRHYAAEALRCSERLGDREFITVATSDLAVAERALGNHDAAAALMRKLLARAGPGEPDQVAVASTRFELAEMLADAHRYGEAEVEILAALELVRLSDEQYFKADMLQLHARIHLLQGRTEEALATATSADVLLRQSFGKAQLYRYDPSWVVRATLGHALRAAGRLPEAILALESSIGLIEAKRAGVGADELTLSAFMRNKAQPYRDLVALLVGQGRPRDALVVAERFRARALATAMARGQVDRLPSMSAADRERYAALNRAIADLNRSLLASGDGSATAVLRERLAEQRIEQQVFLSRMESGGPEPRGAVAISPEVIVGDVHRLLPDPAEALLTFSVQDQETFAFYVERSGDDVDVAVHRIALPKVELEERIRHFVGRIEERNLDYRESARSLYDLLVAPFASRIGSKRRLFIVPDGMLWRLPFQALQSAGGEHLIERIAIAYAPSLALLRHERRQRPRSVTATAPALLALADPLLPPGSDVSTRAVSRGASLGPLPDARAEVFAIAKMYGPASRALVGAQATETTAKKLAAEYPVLHFATHGIIDDASPMYSAVVLGASDTDDGLLEAREMMELDLGADLVVLSACESADGGLTPGEGVVGMSWALMVAGCRNTVVSQWAVDSASTAQLMIAFHRQASLSGADYPFALREAQLALLRNPRFSHPYYWSPFVLITTSQ
ncbi:MAG TPA: CHAT domain-containing protein [Thermoanaerobaculia bacterium]|nr:CHAT domain-containing protein [Thermoanaerobaculia bacterium]